ATGPWSRCSRALEGSWQPCPPVYPQGVSRAPPLGNQVDRVGQLVAPQAVAAREVGPLVADVGEDRVAAALDRRAGGGLVRDDGVLGVGGRPEHELEAGGEPEPLELRGRRAGQRLGPAGDEQ